MNMQIANDLISQINHSFNFKRVHQIMTALDWKYDPVVLIQDTHSRVPTIQEIKNLATSLMRQALFEMRDTRKQYSSVHSGGFLAVATRSYDQSQVKIQLFFAVYSAQCLI